MIYFGKGYKIFMSKDNAKEMAFIIIPRREGTKYSEEDHMAELMETLRGKEIIVSLHPNPKTAPDVLKNTMINVVINM